MFLNEIDIQRLLSLGHTTIGINQQNFKTDFVAFLDRKVYEISEKFQGTLITLPKYKVREPFIHYEYTGWSFTHDYILNWLKGKCKEVILIGCADFIDDKHYNADYLFKPSEKDKNKSIKFIESIKDYKIYKMNPKGILNIPVKEL